MVVVEEDVDVAAAAASPLEEKARRLGRFIDDYDDDEALVCPRFLSAVVDGVGGMDSARALPRSQIRYCYLLLLAAAAMVEIEIEIWSGRQPMNLLDLVCPSTRC